MKVKRSSSKDVAREAGVSQATVSRVFNTSGIPVSESKRQKVLAAADKLGYRPSIIARSLHSQSTKIIGIVVKRFDNEFYMRSLDLFTQLFQQRGYSVMLFNINDEAGVGEKLRTALEYHVAGMIITSANLSSPLVQWCLRFNTPVFLFNRLSEGAKVNSVCSDNLEAGERIADYLYEKGHRRPVYVSGEKDSSTNKERMEGFISGMKKHGIDQVTVVEGDFYYNSGFSAAETVMQQELSFDCVFCGSDYMAMGFYDYFRIRGGLSSPEDFSLIGFDGIPMKHEDLYPITTYRQPLDRMVQKTVQAMIRNIEHFSPEPEHYLFSGEIIERKTVRPR